MIRQFLAVSLAACSVALAAPAPSWAVTEGDLKQAEREFQKFFEGTMVTVLLDMPATAPSGTRRHPAAREAPRGRAHARRISSAI